MVSFTIRRVGATYSYFYFRSSTLPGRDGVAAVHLLVPVQPSVVGDVLLVPETFQCQRQTIVDDFDRVHDEIAIVNEHDDENLDMMTKYWSVCRKFRLPDRDVQYFGVMTNISSLSKFLSMQISGVQK